MLWKYFGATGGTGRTIEIYRLPSESLTQKFETHHFRIMERLLPDGRWVAGQNARVEKDWMDGWFNQDDELDEAEVKRFIEKWNVEGKR